MLSLQVYIPLLSVNQLRLTDGGYHGVAGSQESDAVSETTGDEKQPPAESRGAFEVRDDLLHSTHKFLQVINQTLQQLEGIIFSLSESEKCIVYIHIHINTTIKQLGVFFKYFKRSPLCSPRLHVLLNI